MVCPFVALGMALPADVRGTLRKLRKPTPEGSGEEQGKGLGFRCTLPGIVPGSQQRPVVKSVKKQALTPPLSS